MKWDDILCGYALTYAYIHTADIMHMTRPSRVCDSRQVPRMSVFKRSTGCPCLAPRAGGVRPVSFSHDMPAISFTEKVTLQSQRRVDGEQCAARRRPARHEGHMRGDHCRLHGSGATSPHGTIASTD